MIAFSLFGRPVYRYGIMYMMSFLLGYGFLWYVTSRQLITKVSPTLQAILTDRVDTLLTYIIIGGILGGRLGEVFFYERGYYSQHLGEILQTRQGGMSFVGGIIGALVAVSLFLGFSRPRDTDKKSWLQTLLTLTDLMAVITPLGIMLGRIGNFLNRELYGPIVINLTTLSSRQTPRSFDGSWPFERVSDGVLGIQGRLYPLMERVALIYDYGTSIMFAVEPRLNTNFLAAVMEGLIILIIMLICFVTSRGRRGSGWFSGLFLILYALARFPLEYLRVDSQDDYLWIFTTTQWLSIIMIIAGVGLLLYSRHHHKQTTT